MPQSPYTISGTVKKGPREGYEEVNTTVDTDAGAETVNLFLDAGVSNATSQTVYIYNITQAEVNSVTTDSSGNYTFNLADMTADYANGDSIRVFSSDITATRQFDNTDTTGVTDSMSTYKPSAHEQQVRPIEAGRQGGEFTEVYPKPVQIMNLHINSENPSSVMTYSSGLIATETVTIGRKSYRKTYTWSSGTLTNESVWEEL